MKNRTALIAVALCIMIALCGCGSTDKEAVQEQTVLISVQRTGNFIQGVGAMTVLIDDEEVFEVSNGSTEAVQLTMTEGTHTIQTKAQGDKSKKLKFDVVHGETNEFYYTSEVSMVWGIDLEERKYIVE